MKSTFLEREGRVLGCGVECGKKKVGGREDGRLLG